MQHCFVDVQKFFCRIHNYPYLYLYQCLILVWLTLADKWQSFKLYSLIMFGCLFTIHFIHSFIFTSNSAIQIMYIIRTDGVHQMHTYINYSGENPLNTEEGKPGATQSAGYVEFFKTSSSTVFSLKDSCILSIFSPRFFTRLKIMERLSLFLWVSSSHWLK